MEEFLNEINRLRFDSQRIENVDISHFIDETEKIGQQLTISQEFLLKEIQRLKKDFDEHYTKLNYANELQAIDEKTLKTFKTKFEDLTQLLADVKSQEINAWHIIQILRVNTSRLWHILETAVGISVNDELINKDLEKLLSSTQIEKDAQTTCLILLEKEHGDLLIKMKQIQISLEHFRTSILKITKNRQETKLKLNEHKQMNDRIHEQTSKGVNHLIHNIKDVRCLLVDYKHVTDDVENLIKLIFHIQTQIEISHKTKLMCQTKLERYKQDLALNILNRTTYEIEISKLKKRIREQNQNFQQLKNQQEQILRNRQELYTKIDTLDIDNNHLLNSQQQFIDMIKQSNLKRISLEKDIFHTNHIRRQNLQYSYRKLILDQNKQQNITNNFQKLIQMNADQLERTKFEQNNYSEKIKQQNRFINRREFELDAHTKELQDLDICLSKTQEQLMDQRTIVNETKAKVKHLQQKMHKLISDEKPLAKEISQSQKQVKHNQMNYIQLELNLKQNESKINHYKKRIGKLLFNVKENNQIIDKENFLLRRSFREKEQSIENIKILNMKLNSSEFNYQRLKETFHYVENQNKRLQQQYANLTFLVQILGHRQATINNRLEPLYKNIKYFNKRHVHQIKSIDQSKSDVNILKKYYSHLRLYNKQLRESISLKSQQNTEYLNVQTISNQYNTFQNQLEAQTKKNANHIHYWHILMANSPDKFDDVSKLFLIKKKLIHKTDELIKLKTIFHEKETLFCSLNLIFERRMMYSFIK